MAKPGSLSTRRRSKPLQLLTWIGLGTAGAAAVFAAFLLTPFVLVATTLSGKKRRTPPGSR